MSIEKAKAHLKKYDLEQRVLEFETSSATVELAAQAVGCIPARITKTLSFAQGEDCILVATAGDAKIDNQKFKGYFEIKAKMLSPEKVVELTNHEIGGVCPFGVTERVKTYCDISMKRFDTVFPACGSSNSAIELSCEELEKASHCIEWIDVCKGWEE